MTQEDRVDDGDPHAEPGGSTPVTTVPDAGTDAPPQAGAFGAPGSFGAPGAPGGPQGPTGATENIARFFDRIRAFGAVRPSEGRWFAGSCAAVAERTGIDPVLVRGITVVLTLLGGAGVFLYAAAWLLLPAEDGRIHAQELIAGRPSAPSVWAAVLFVLSLGTSSQAHGGWLVGMPWIPGIVWVGLIVAGLIFWASKHQSSAATGSPAGAAHQGRTWQGGNAWQGGGSWQTSGAATTSGTWQATATAPSPSAPTAGAAWSSGAPTVGWTPPPPTPPRAPRPPDLHRPLHALTMATVGVALIACAVVVLWDRSVHTVPGGAFVGSLAAALIVVALGVVLAGLLGRRCGGLAPIGVLLALTLAPSAAFAANDDVHMFGERTVHLSAAAVNGNGETDPVDVGAGSLILDLTAPDLARAGSTSRPVQVTARVGAGRLVVRLPEGVAVEVRSQVGAGTVRQAEREAADSTDGRFADDGDVDGRDDVKLASGTGLDRTDTFGAGEPVLQVDVQVGLGELRIVTPQGVEVTP